MGKSDFFFAKKSPNMSPQYTKSCRIAAIRGYLFQIFKFKKIQEKSWFLPFWRYNGENGVSLLFHQSEKKIFS